MSAVGTLNLDLVYDPLGRLWQTSGSSYGTSQYLYDGDRMVAEYDGATGAMRRRFAFGPGEDEPILWDEGSALDCSGTRVLHADQQGSIVALADCAGNPVQTNSYDEYGVPGAEDFSPTLPQRFLYTGQMYLPELGMYYYAVGAGSLGYDANGNLAATGSTSLTYDVENQPAPTCTMNFQKIHNPMTHSAAP